MSRRRIIAALVALAVTLGIAAGWWQMRAFRARWEGRRPALDVMRQRPSDIGLAYEQFSATNPEGTRICPVLLPP